MSGLSQRYAAVMVAATIYVTRPTPLIAKCRAFTTGTALASLISRHDPHLVLGPLCLGDHVDHHIVRDALAQVSGSRSMLLWEDWPYADRVATVSAAPALVTLLDPHGRSARLAACLPYRTQLGFQFGAAEALRGRMERIILERFHAPVI